MLTFSAAVNQQLGLSWHVYYNAWRALLKAPHSDTCNGQKLLVTEARLPLRPNFDSFAGFDTNHFPCQVITRVRACFWMSVQLLLIVMLPKLAWTSRNTLSYAGHCTTWARVCPTMCAATGRVCHRTLLSVSALLTAFILLCQDRRTALLHHIYCKWWMSSEWCSMHEVLNRISMPEFPALLQGTLDLKDSSLNTSD